MSSGPSAASEPPRASLVLILACLPWLALLAWLASVSWFLTDDAFISFRYARNLLEGHGLVFNPGERVEGYSNFLWTLELAAIWRALGVAPEDAAPWLSAACTAGTLGALAWWVYRLPSLRNRGLVGWMALGLVCGSATFAVWTSGGGLETRQFTFFIVLAVVCLSLYRDRRAGLLAASLSLAGAALTRPEGPLIAACCFGWFFVQRMADAKRLRADWRELAYLAAPFVILTAAHFLFRYAYYGEWLPNTYYAKHVRPWYEAGFRYLWAAALDTGLYLLIPLAWVALRHRWRETRDGILCPGSAADRRPHGLCDADWRRPFRVSPVGLLLALAGAAGCWGDCLHRLADCRLRLAAHTPLPPTLATGSKDLRAYPVHPRHLLLRRHTGSPVVRGPQD